MHRQETDANTKFKAKDALAVLVLLKTNPIPYALAMQYIEQPTDMRMHAMLPSRVFNLQH